MGHIESVADGLTSFATYLSAEASQQCAGEKLLSDCYAEPLEAQIVIKESPRSRQRSLTIETPSKAATERIERPFRSPTDFATPKRPPSSSGIRFKDHAFATHALLRKHYKYLLPWVSKQPGTPVEESKAKRERTTSEYLYRMADEFRRMSLSHFTELSTAVYYDVHRRDDQAPPASPQPQRPDPWTRNKQNESRMVLCRIGNEQYHWLVMAVVLEQARRLAEIRIRIHRQSLAAKQLFADAVGPITPTRPNTG